MTETNHLSPANSSRGAALASFVSALLAVVASAVFFFTSFGALPMIAAIVLGALAVILGIVALVKRQPKGLAITGLILGAFCVLLGLAIIVFALIFVGAFMTQSPYN